MNMCHSSCAFSSELISLYSLFGEGELLGRQQRRIALTSRLFSLQDVREELLDLDAQRSDDYFTGVLHSLCRRARPYLLQTGAQVAAEHEADPVDLHAMDAGLRVAFRHPLQVGFLSEEKVRTPSGIIRVYCGSEVERRRGSAVRTPARAKILWFDLRVT